MPFDNSLPSAREATYCFNQIRALHLNKENTKIPKNEEPEVSASGPKHGPGTTDVFSNTSIVPEPQDLYKRGFDMSAGFIKFHRCKEFEEMVEHHPIAFVLLAVIAQRAKRTNEFSALGLQIGEALLGDYENYGMTRKQYRVSLEKLLLYGFVAIKRASKGTIAKLLKNNIFDINYEQEGAIKTAIEGPSRGHQRATNKNERKKECKKKKLYSSDSIEIGLCKKLFEYVSALEKSVKEPDFDSWAIHMGRLLNTDKRSIEEVHETMKWLYTSDNAQAEFWRGNVLSADGLRKKWTKIQIAMKKKPREVWAPQKVDRTQRNVDGTLATPEHAELF